MLINDGGRVTGVLTPERWQLTNVADLLELNRKYLGSEPQRATVLTKSIGQNVQIHPPVRIEAGVVIGDDCVIGPDLSIEADCQIGAGVELRNAIVLRGAVIPPTSHIVDTVVMGSPSSPVI
ncbi:MAG: hypothetical protein R2932_58280 [Caldilineaceae bacterium]